MLEEGLLVSSLVNTTLGVATVGGGRMFETPRLIMCSTKICKRVPVLLDSSYALHQKSQHICFNVCISLGARPSHAEKEGLVNLHMGYGLLTGFLCNN